MLAHNGDTHDGVFGVKLPAYLHFSRHRIYYFRIRVPLALVPLVKGYELCKSLLGANSRAVIAT